MPGRLPGDGRKSLRKNDGKRTFCPVSKIDWGLLFHGDRRPVLGNGEPDPEGELTGIERLVSRYQAPYTDPAARDWIERRLRAWGKGRND
jgi:hypothetical protein